MEGRSGSTACTASLVAPSSCLRLERPRGACQEPQFDGFVNRAIRCRCLPPLLPNVGAVALPMQRVRAALGELSRQYSNLRCLLAEAGARDQAPDRISCSATAEGLRASARGAT